MSKKYKVLVVAGESSGDILGAGLIRELKAKFKNNISFIGIGGSEMEAEGVPSMFDLSEFAVMGLTEVLPRVPLIKKRIRQTVHAAQAEKVDAIVTIDSPDFTLRVAKAVKAEMDIPAIHFVSPHVWAWRKKRIYKMKEYLNEVLALFPFEPKVYEKAGLACTYVGHPVAERLESYMPKRAKALNKKAPRIALVPGSRVSEISRMMPELVDAFKRIKASYPDAQAVVPIADHINRSFLESFVDDKFEYTHGQERFDVLKKCDVALVTSGTANLELAMLGLPMVVGYKLSKLTYAIAKPFVKIKYFSPVNLVVDEQVVPELLQKGATGQHFAEKALEILSGQPERKKQLDGMKKVRETLLSGGKTASERAAEAVAKHLKG